MSYSEVFVLFDGYSKVSEDGKTMSANCSCTLIKSKGHLIIVDTMTPWDKDKLLNELRSKHDVQPDQIDFVVCTHGHSDHIGNNNLFLNALHIVGQSVSKKDSYDLTAFQNGQNFEITEDVHVFPTPGHTLDSVSVKVKTEKGVFVIAGDLFECQDDLENDQIWRDAGSEDPKLQEENRRKVLQMADFVVPGHGSMFSNAVKSSP